jgi:hypothetical protein
VAARALRLAGNQGKAREHASRASEILSGLERQWGTDAYESYLRRPDVQDARRSLEEILAAGP